MKRYSRFSALRFATLGSMLLLLAGLITTLTLINTSTDYQKKAVEPVETVSSKQCYQVCQIGVDSCERGLSCGNEWCKAGENCTKEWRCYNQNCPEVANCICQE